MLKILFLSVCLAYTVVSHAQRTVHDFVAEHTFTDGIEGPATDRKGNVYAVNYQRQGTIGILKPDGSHGIYATLPGNSVGNGIEVSPDGRHLYVGESAQLKLWKYDLLEDGTLTNKQLFHRFEGYGMDGMRCDINGNLYLTRYDKGTVVILNPEGNLLEEIPLQGKKPCNLTFGGRDRKRCYITLADRGCLEYFDADFPGRE